MTELSQEIHEILDDDTLKLAYIAKRRVQSCNINKNRYITDEKYRTEQKEKSKIAYNKYKNAVQQLKLINI
jgi:hypothetical protein